MSNYMNKRIRDSSSNDFPKTTKKLQHQPKELQLIVSTSVLIVLLLIWENIYQLTIAYIQQLNVSTSIRPKHIIVSTPIIT